MTQPSPKPKGHVWTASDAIAVFALLVSAAAAVFAVVQTQRANEISESAYSLSEALSPKVDVFINSIDASVGTREGVQEPEVRLEMELVNTGQVHLSGCTTRWQGSDSSGQPGNPFIGYQEPGGETWDVAPGDKHVSVAFVPLDLNSPPKGDASTTHVAAWFECQSAALVSTGFLYGIDLETQYLLGTNGAATEYEHRPLRELPPFGWWERQDARMGGSYPYPSPVPTPQFTLRGTEED